MAAFDTSRPTTSASAKGFMAFVFFAIERITAWNESRQTRQMLSRLSDHALEDIGLTRSDLKSF